MINPLIISGLGLTYHSERCTYIRHLHEHAGDVQAA